MLTGIFFFKSEFSKNFLFYNGGLDFISLFFGALFCSQSTVYNT